MARVLFRAIPGTLVMHPSATQRLSQWKPACHLGVSGNAMLKLPALHGLGSHVEGALPTVLGEGFQGECLGKLSKSTSLILSFRICQIFLHLSFLPP